MKKDEGMDERHKSFFYHVLVLDYWYIYNYILDFPVPLKPPENLPKKHIKNGIFFISNINPQKIKIKANNKTLCSVIGRHTKHCIAMICFSRRGITENLITRSCFLVPDQRLFVVRFQVSGIQNG